MWEPDIDIIVICKDTRKTSLEVLQKLINLRLFQKYEYGDFVNFKRTNRPESFIMNLKLPCDGQRWEIEIWFFNEMPNNQKEINELIENNLNNSNKKIILEMKKQRCEKGLDKHKISSVDIYKAVLLKNITNFNQLI